MITWFRQLARSWVAKLLFVLLILSFAIWGVEDVVRNLFRDQAVVRMAGGDLELPEAQAAARRELQRIQSQLGGQFEPTEQIRRAVAAQAVENLVQERAQRSEALRLGIATPEGDIRDYVLAIPSFQVGGRFSRPILDQFLRQNDMTEAQFLLLVRDDLQRMQLLGAVRAGAAAPDLLARALVAHEREQRIATLVELPLLEAPEPATPSEAELARFHANNPERFSTPELRDVTIALLSAEALADQVEIAESDLLAAYEARRASYETPERRGLEQILVPEEQAARTLAAAWADPAATFALMDAAARAAGGGALALGDRAAADLPLPALAEAAFALPRGGVSAPIRSPFGWHVLRVATITAASRTELATVATELRRELARERAADLAFERANRMEDALAGGTSLLEAANRQGAQTLTVTLDRTGRDAAGLPVPLPVPVEARGDLFRSIATTEPGRTPRLAELRGTDAFAAIEVRAVTPAALRPLAEVIDDVRLAFATESRRRAQEERAAALLAAARAGATLAAAAASANLPADRIGPIGREAPTGTASPVPEELLPALFATLQGQTTMVPTRRGYAVAQVLEVLRPDPDAEPEALANARRAAQQQVAGDLEVLFAAALRARVNARVNAGLMQQVAP
jgi:peptidyl-prolyl cis-trans isomerase D